MNKDVCVYILTHNRPNDILRSLNSVRKQDFPNLKIVVSDNSDNDTTTELLKDLIRSDARINYIRRGKECSSANAHFNYIFSTKLLQKREMRKDISNVRNKSISLYLLG